MIAGSSLVVGGLQEPEQEERAELDQEHPRQRRAKAGIVITAAGSGQLGRRVPGPVRRTVRARRHRRFLHIDSL